MGVLPQVSSCQIDALPFSARLGVPYSEPHFFEIFDVLTRERTLVYHHAKDEYE